MITTVKEAWMDFVETVKPEIWEGLSRKQRMKIFNAHRDFLEKRKDRSGKPIRLTDERIKSILQEHAPEKYLFQSYVTILPSPPQFAQAGT